MTHCLCIKINGRRAEDCHERIKSTKLSVVHGEEKGKAGRGLLYNLATARGRFFRAVTSRIDRPTRNGEKRGEISRARATLMDDGGKIASPVLVESVIGALRVPP